MSGPSKLLPRTNFLCKIWFYILISWKFINSIYIYYIQFNRIVIHLKMGVSLMHPYVQEVRDFFDFLLFSSVRFHMCPQIACLLKMHSRIGYMCLAFLHCAFSNVLSNCLPENRHSHIGYICLAFLHCVFSNELSNYLPWRMHSRIDCICVTLWICFHPLC